MAWNHARFCKYALSVRTSPFHLSLPGGKLCAFQDLTQYFGGSIALSASATFSRDVLNCFSSNASYPSDPTGPPDCCAGGRRCPLREKLPARAYRLGKVEAEGRGRFSPACPCQSPLSVRMPPRCQEEQRTGLLCQLGSHTCAPGCAWGAQVAGDGGGCLFCDGSRIWTGRDRRTSMAMCGEPRAL